MQCPECRTLNDGDALFCFACGKALPGTTRSLLRSRRSYLFLLILVPVLVGVLGLGYFKFVLPDGIAAVVNGEEIKIAELDAAVNRSPRNSADSRFRYEALNMLIMERLILQEARSAGVAVSPEDLAAATATARSAVKADASAFERMVGREYGSWQAYEEILRRRLLIDRFLPRLVPPNADPETARRFRELWMQETMSRASIRIALSEEVGSRCSEQCGAEHTGCSTASGEGNGLSHACGGVCSRTVKKLP